VDDSTFRQLRESKYYHPELTEVMFDSEMMLAMSLDSINLANNGFDIVWDKIMFRFMWKEFKDGIFFAEKQSKEKGIKLRLIVEITEENLPFLNLLRYYDIRHLADLRGNFGIFDNRAYMVQIFHKESSRPDQTLWSNSKDLVNKQQTNFDNLWEIATPLEIRSRELDQSTPDYRKLITGNENVLDEIGRIFEQSKKELLIFSSTKILCNILNRNNFVNSKIAIKKKGND